MLFKFIKKYKKKLKFNRLMESVEQGLDYKFVVHHTKNNTALLAQLCDKYGSDKGEIKTSGHPYSWPSHTYSDYYARLFEHCRLNVKKVFECGLGTNNPSITSNMTIDGKPGASLRVWRDYFPNAQVFGADIDRDVLFEEDRIKTFYVDQLNPQAIDGLWQQVGLNDFDFILDDGLHTFEAGSCLFENSVAKLAPNGVYIIEDVFVSDILKYKAFFANKNFAVDYVLMFRPNSSLGDNCLVVIRHA